MGSRSPVLVVDPLAFSLRAVGGVARVWSNVLPQLVDSEVCLKFTCGMDGREVFKDGLEAAIGYLKRSHRIPAGIRRFVPYHGEGDLFFPTYFRPCRRGLPNIQLVHDCIKELYYPVGKLALARFRKKRIYRNASALIAISDATRLDLLRLYGEEIEDRIRVIHNPVDLGHLQRCSSSGKASPEFAQVSARIGARPFALFIGYRSGLKNFREARHLLNALPDHVLVAVGPAPTPDEELLARAFKDRIVYTGPLRDEVMFSLLGCSEFLFFPSMLEGFGLPVVESLLLGTSVLALDTQVNREISLGLITFFETGSSASIRAAVAGLKRVDVDGPIHRQLSERYDPRTVAQSYLRVIREFL